MRDLDEEYDDLMDELEAAVEEVNSLERGERLQAIRIRLEDVLRMQTGLTPRRPPADQRLGPNALN